MQKGGVIINQLVLIGRLTKDPIINESDGKKYSSITIATKRQYKNSDGIYETDFITCSVWNVIAEKVCQYCQKGDLVSIRGRIQNNNYTQDDKKVFSYEIIADQVSFMQSHNKNDLEEISKIEKE